MVHESSGILQLDRVLGGGLSAGAVVLVMGPAGSGKTTLALQVAFSAASRGQHTCFVSTTSESPKRLLEHARTYDFYDEGEVGRRIFLLNVYPLIQEGLQPVREALEREVRERSASLLVLDGLMTVYDLHPEPREVRSFVFELSATLSTLGCTLMVTSSRADPGNVAEAAELTMADVLISLSQHVERTRAYRSLRAIKVRGQKPLLGLHTARLDRRGLAIFPRFESLDPPAVVRDPDGRTVWGLPELDEMLSGGLPAASVTALAGAVGTGKTLLALQFLLAGPGRGERGVLLSLRETEREMIAKARGFGLDLETPIRNGSIRLVHHSPVDLSVDEAIHGLIAILEQHSADRFVLDGIAELLDPIAEEPRRHALMRVLSDQVRFRGITTIVPVPVAQAVGPELDLERTPMAALAQNLLLMRYAEFRGELHRILSILKVRDSHFDPSIRRYLITSDGLRILAPAETPEGLLMGISRLASEARVKRVADPEDEP